MGGPVHEQVQVQVRRSVELLLRKGRVYRLWDEYRAAQAGLKRAFCDLCANCALLLPSELEHYLPGQERGRDFLARDCPSAAAALRQRLIWCEKSAASLQGDAEEELDNCLSSRNDRQRARYYVPTTLCDRSPRSQGVPGLADMLR